MKKETVKHASEEPIQNTKNSSSKKALIVVILIVLLLVIGVLAAVVYKLVIQPNDDPSSSNSNKNTLVTLSNKNDVAADLQNKTMSGMFEASMSVNWSFENSSTSSPNAYVANVTTNTNTIYFDVKIDSTNQLVYESPDIPVGYALQDVTLTTNLEAGTYPCTLTYHLVDDNHNEISTVSVAVTLNVLN